MAPRGMQRYIYPIDVASVVKNVRRTVSSRSSLLLLLKIVVLLRAALLRTTQNKNGVKSPAADLPKTMKAIKSDGKGGLAFVADAPVPDVPEGYVLVKVSHVALNPVDWQSLDGQQQQQHQGATGLTLGCDFSGTVVKLGPGVGQSSTGRGLSTGSRVLGFAHGQRPGWPERGCLAEYALCLAGLTVAVPAGMSGAAACTLGLGCATVGQGLYQRLNLPWPDQAGASRPHDILVHGGGTATGGLAVQLAALSGWRVLATCSPTSADHCRALGATATFDRRDPEACAAAVRLATNGQLLHALDCHGGKDGPRMCADALTPEKGRANFATVDGDYEAVRDGQDVWQSSICAFTCQGEAFADHRGRQWEARPKDRAFATRFFALVQDLVAQGKIRCFPIEREGGLSVEAITKGLDDLRSGKVAGGKLVYQID